MFLTDIRNRARGQPIRRQQLRDDHHATSYVLREVQEALLTVRSDWTLANFGLPLPDDILPALEQQNEIETHEARAQQWEERLQTSLPLLNTNQRHAFDEIVGSMLPGVSVSALLQGSSSAVAGPSMPTRSGRLFFLDAPGGTGKTFVLSAIQDFLRTRRKQVIAVATSAVAAVLLDGGGTAHSVFKVPIPVSAESTCSFSANSDTGRTLQQVDLIIWDEIVMCHRHCIETVDRSPRDLMQTDRPFGGKFFVLAGDFRQILPVVPGGSRGQISVAFKHTIRNLCLKVFQGVRDNHADPAWLTKRVILTTKNRPLDEVNEVIGNMIPGPCRTYLIADKVENEDTNALIYPTEMLNTLTAGSALPDHKLKLKKGFIVMLLRNLDPATGHVNGARYVIENMTKNLLFLRVTTGSHQGNRLFLPRMPCGPGDDNFPIPGFTRTQFPIRTCFALTTNKAQGQSFGGRIGLDLRDYCFSHGQLYVALSRTTHPGNVTVLTRESNETTRNIVYPEVLQ
ncbi:partial DNA helicase [Chondrus crispus]|uniref:ATP-dependent DNA helicase n=1 Tax=Chondrus crispus TaxID=2769 RepID=R7QE14_CHOCR|nr:partial DNA helicase [Chondrus crispus]CDF35670.1 partial DNA helicase [Chondrus crispus]